MFESFSGDRAERFRRPIRLAQPHPVANPVEDAEPRPAGDGSTGVAWQATTAADGERPG